jgi:diaminohydroxyphosphoribosylaminopyrimidine deaminase / 5-amino-6-(5-phosphoribosylamino)uracil reductase
MTAHSLSHRSVRTVAEDDDILAPLIAASTSRPYIIAQLGQSLDGRIATPTGASRWINRDCALDHLHRIRANVDAVVVGIGTIIADDPLLTVRRVSGSQPARVVIDTNGRLSHTARCLASNGAPCLIVRSDAGPVPVGAEAVVVPRAGPFVAPADIVAALFARGLRKILIEGGATTVSSFIDAGVVDRLHVLVAPIILGSGVTGLSLTPIRGLDEAFRPVTRVHVLDDGDVVFDCDLRNKDRG